MGLPVVTDVRPLLGCDPEFFFTKKNKVIGSELVLPEAGHIVPIIHHPSNHVHNKIIRDGVQAEFNTTPNTCRDSVGYNIMKVFREIDGKFIKTNKDLGISFNQLVKVTKPNMKKLSEKSRRFGCSPSSSIYGDNIDISAIDSNEYRYRAAGGHIHLGVNSSYGEKSGLHRALKVDVERTVQMLDIICGNTLVLVDRDKGNKERRKVYGRAGEYRTPAHGIEYRTPSNFWLRSKPLMSLAFGLARFAVVLMADKNYEKYYKAFTEAVDMRNIQLAINTNNFTLAMKNFKAIEPLLLEAAGAEGLYGTYPLCKDNIKYFYFFVDKIKSEGIEYWFPYDPMQEWVKEHSGHYYKGINDFLLNNVHAVYKKEVLS